MKSHPYCHPESVIENGKTLKNVWFSKDSSLSLDSRNELHRRLIADHLIVLWLGTPMPGESEWIDRSKIVKTYVEFLNGQWMRVELTQHCWQSYIKHNADQWRAWRDQK